MDEYLISVIIPVYNSASFLPACISSLSPADNEDVEILIIDDGSTDSSARLVDEYNQKYENIRVFHKKNGGSTSARNLGLAQAKGDWIWFVDSDDYVSPFAFSVIRHVTETRIADLFYAPLIFFKKEDRIKWVECADPTKMVSGTDFLKATYKGEYQHYNQQFIYSRRLLKKCGAYLGRDLSSLYREDIFMYEDVLFCETLLRAARYVCCLPAGIYACRRNMNSVTNKPSDKSVESGLSAIDLLKQYPDFPDTFISKRAMEIGLLFSLYKLTESSSHDLRKKITAEIDCRYKVIGHKSLSVSLRVRYILLKLRLLDAVLFARRCCAYVSKFKVV